ncbi:MAG TPA: hypothetical protein VKT54_13865 [Steroidobacteraceae bacterium]|nr:hypothetical protein [Steroidobacteraceae bacterium]
MTDTNTALHATLSARRGELAAVRSQHEADQRALDLVRRRIAAAQADLERVGADDQAAVGRLARRFAQAARDGDAGPVPTPVSSDKHEAARSAARLTLVAATEAAAALEAAERKSRQARASAESAHRAAALAIIAAEIDAEAEAISRDDAALEQRRQRLRGARAVVPPSAAVRHAAPTTQDWVHIPLGELRELEEQGRAGGTDSLVHVPRDQHGRVEISAEAIAFWEQRLEALLSGAAEPGEPAQDRAA